MANSFIDLTGYTGGMSGLSLADTDSFASSLGDITLADLFLSSDTMDKAQSTATPQVNITYNYARTNVTDSPNGGTVSGDDMPKSFAFTREQVRDLTKGVTSLVSGIGSVYNGYITKSAKNMQANNKEFEAKQNERAADILMKNQRDVMRSAQMDANVYRMQRAQTRSAQKVAMAESGFAVGKGAYKSTLDKTDSITNYNISAVMLKAELQNAELTRQAGEKRAQAIINRADRDILKAEGRNAVTKGWETGMAKGLEAGAYFYTGFKGI